MKHFFIILLIIAIIKAGIFLPYLPGDYDFFAVGISHIFQVAAFASLLLVPLGLIWWILDFINRNKDGVVIYPVYLRNIALGVVVIMMIAAALGAFMSQNRFAAIFILAVGGFAFMAIHRKVKHVNQLNVKRQHITPYYFIMVPISVLLIRTAFLERTKNDSTDFVITQAQQLIQDIEAYKKANGHYPVSLLYTIEDYKPGMSGISRFYYEPKGEAYNIYFEQLSDMIGTQEFVMYNKLDEQEMTVHNQDLLRLPYNTISHGHHKVDQLPTQHWKVFYFD